MVRASSEVLRVVLMRRTEVPYPDGDMMRAGTRDVHLKLLLRLLQWDSHEGAYLSTCSSADL